MWPLGTRIEPWTEVARDGARVKGTRPRRPGLRDEGPRRGNEKGDILRTFVKHEVGSILFTYL